MPGPAWPVPTAKGSQPVTTQRIFINNFSILWETAPSQKEGKAKTQRGRCCEPPWFHPPFAPALSPPWGQEEGEPSRHWICLSKWNLNCGRSNFLKHFSPKICRGRKQWNGWQKPGSKVAEYFLFALSERAGELFLLVMGAGSVLGNVGCETSPQPWAARAEDNWAAPLCCRRLWRLIAAAQTRSQWHQRGEFGDLCRQQCKGLRGFCRSCSTLTLVKSFPRVTQYTSI